VGVGVARCPPEGGGHVGIIHDVSFLAGRGAAVRAVCETKARHNGRSWHESKDRNVGFLLTGIETMVDVLEWPRLIGLE
jgi:hypothetical protein